MAPLTAPASASFLATAKKQFTWKRKSSSLDFCVIGQGRGSRGSEDLPKLIDACLAKKSDQRNVDRGDHSKRVPAQNQPSISLHQSERKTNNGKAWNGVGQRKGRWNWQTEEYSGEGDRRSDHHSHTRTVEKDAETRSDHLLHSLINRASEMDHLLQRRKGDAAIQDKFREPGSVSEGDAKSGEGDGQSKGD